MDNNTNQFILSATGLNYERERVNGTRQVLICLISIKAPIVGAFYIRKPCLSQSISQS